MTLYSMVAAALAFFGVKDAASVETAERFVQGTLATAAVMLLGDAISALNGGQVDWGNAGASVLAGVLVAFLHYMRERGQGAAA